MFNKRFIPLYLLLLLVAAPVINSGLQAEGLTPRQVAKIKNVGSALVTPDGNYIAFTKVVPQDPFETNTPANLELHVLDRSTGEIRLVELESRAGNLLVRPGHNTFSFTTRGPDDSAVSLYELDPASGEITRLYHHEAGIMAYSWHPSGTIVSLVSREQLDRPENPLPYEPTVFEENIPNRDAFIVRLEEAEPERQRIQVEGAVYLMEWSPDGRYLAISETPTPNIDDFYMYQQVKVIDAASAQVRNEIDNAGKLAQITWSPDGSQLALRAGNSIHDPIDGRIMVVSASGGAPDNIYPEFEGKFERITWSDDGLIRFLASESTATTFGTISADGSGFNRILHVEEGYITNFTYANDGTVVFTKQTPDHPTEIFVKEAGADELVRVTVSNEWLADVPMGRQVVVSYEARDGRNIEGLLIYPLDENGGPYPTIVVVHGGPEAHYSNGWLTAYSLAGQVGAARGFAVFYPNYRGSTGRGLEFIKSSQADLSGAEFDDIVDGVDFLIEEGITDADRVGVTGGSYGGYATAWMSTYYSHRFAAGVMFVGISNNISKWGTSDIPEELYLVHSRKRLWDDWQDKLERSPIYHVDNSQTPLLIMHGEDDTRVHPAQSLELFRHIKVRKPEVPLRLIWYPDEGHGNIRSTSRFDYHLRMLQWFETYLLEDDPELPSFYLDLEALGVEKP
jgi:dipeptidyl aminopeptidase/acylaminoacyl peptidase